MRKKNTKEYDKKTPLPLMCTLSFQRISRENTCTKLWYHRNIDILYGRRREQRQRLKERVRERDKTRMRNKCIPRTWTGVPIQLSLIYYYTAGIHIRCIRNDTNRRYCL